MPDAGATLGHQLDSGNTKRPDGSVPPHPDASFRDTGSDIPLPDVGVADTSISRPDVSPRDADILDAHVVPPHLDAHVVPPHPDGSPPPPDGSAPDAAPRRCNPNGAFGPPQSPGAAFAPPTNYEDEGMTLTPDGLTAYFASTRPASLGDYDIFIATRASVDDPFDVAAPLPGPVNTPSRQRQPSISPDGRLLFYSDDSDIFVAGRGTVDVPFGEGAPVDNVNTSVGEREPFIASDGKSLYFASDRSSTSKIYVSKMDDAGRFGEPRLILDSALSGSPVLSRDQLTMYVQSTRDGRNWIVKRTSVEDAFDFAQAMQLDAILDARWPEALSPDECTLYFVAVGLHRSLWMGTRSR